jgi:hypothetical protein
MLDDEVVLYFHKATTFIVLLALGIVVASTGAMLVQLVIDRKKLIADAQPVPLHSGEKLVVITASDLKREVHNNVYHAYFIRSGVKYTFPVENVGLGSFTSQFTEQKPQVYQEAPPQPPVQDFQDQLGSSHTKIVLTQEMAFPASTINPFGPEDQSSTTVTGVVCFRIGKDKKPYGMGFRASFAGESFLITAAHVWNGLLKHPDDVEKYIEHKGSCFKLVKNVWKMSFFSPDNDIMILKPLTEAAWSKMSLQGLKLSFKATGSGTVYGFKDNQLSYSLGKFHTQGFELFHGISTLSGWSGSPVIQGDSVVGIHLGAMRADNLNFGATNWWTTFLKKKDTESDQMLQKGLKWVDELPEETTKLRKRNMKFYSPYNDYDVVVVGSSVKLLSSTRRDTASLGTWDFEDEYLDSQDFRNLAPGRFYESILPDVPVAVTPLPDFPKAFHSISANSTPLESMFGKMEPCQQPKLLELALNQGELVHELCPEKPNPRNRAEFYTTPQYLDRRLQSGAILPEELPPSTEVSNSRPENTEVFLCLFTRRQEKLYNSIIRHPRYRVFSTSLSDLEYSRLRKSLLEWTLSPLRSRSSQALDFLSAYSIQLMEESLRRCQDSSNLV